MNLQPFKKYTMNEYGQNNTNTGTKQYKMLRMNIPRMENRCMIPNDDKKTKSKSAYI